MIAIIPYSLALQGNAPTPANLPMPLPVLAAIQIGVQVVVFALLIGLGLFLASHAGLESAMLSPFSAVVVLHVLFAL